MKKSLLLTSLQAAFLSFQNTVKKVPIEEQSGLRQVEPPELLYVRLTEEDCTRWYGKGLPKTGGHYWLWCNMTKAVGRAESGYRVLAIEAKAMYDAGHKFWLASDGSYAVREIPDEFIQ